MFCENLSPIARISSDKFPHGPTERSQIAPFSEKLLSPRRKTEEGTAARRDDPFFGNRETQRSRVYFVPTPNIVSISLIAI